MILILTLLLTIAIFLFIRYRDKLKKLEKIGILHKKPWPIVGNMGGTLFRLHSFTDAINEAYYLREDAKYVGFYDFGTPVVIIKCPELIKDIGIKRFDHFVDHRGFVDAEMDPLFANNLVSLRGDKWREMRNLLSPAFTSSKLKSMFQLMNACGESYADYTLKKAAEEQERGYEVASKSFFTRYTTDVIATCAFGISVNSLKNPDNEFYKIGTNALNFNNSALSIKFFLLRSFPFITKLFRIKLFAKYVEDFFKGIVEETIETRKRCGISRPDMIQLMIESQQERNLNLLEMTSQAFVFFFGGFDTTSTLMSFAAHQIAAYPEVQDKLRQEIRSVLETTGGELTYEAINRMEYLDAVISETQRIYPLAFFLDRVCVKPYDMPPAFEGADPVKLQPGDCIWIPNYSLHRDPKYFDDPNEFKPERFMSDEKSKINPFVYLPFGIGPRICIGNRFGLLETKVILVHLVAKCDLQPGSKMKLPLQFLKTFGLIVDGGHWLQFRARKDPVLFTIQKTNDVKDKTNDPL